MVRSRSVECLSFPLTVTTLLTSTSWVLYGLQVSDLYIMVRLTYLFRTFNTAPNVYSFLDLPELFPPVCICFRSRTPQESSPASSDFICSGNLDLLGKVHLLTSLCPYEGLWNGNRWALKAALHSSLHFFVFSHMVGNRTSEGPTWNLHSWVWRSDFLGLRLLSKVPSPNCHQRSAASADLPTCRGLLSPLSVSVLVYWVENFLPF